MGISRNFSKKINIKPNGSFFIDVPITEPLSNVIYNDTLDGNKIVVFDAITDDCEYDDEPLNMLIFLERISKLRLKFVNQEYSELSGKIDLTFDFDDDVDADEPVRLNLGFESTNIVGMGEMILESEIENNYYINTISPIFVNYFRTEPDLDSADYLLNEYGVHELVEDKCVRTVTKNNSLPNDADAVFTDWGYQFARFAISFSKIYFEYEFGRGKAPRAGDFVIFQLGGMMMNVSSVQPIYGANRCLIGYLVSLAYNAINKSVENIEQLSDYAETSESFFNSKNMDEMKDATNSTYNLSKYVHDDYNRSVLESNVKVIEEADFKYYSIFNQYEAIKSSITYKGFVDITKPFAISFSIKNCENDSLFMIGKDMYVGVLDKMIYVNSIGIPMLISDIEIDPEEWTDVLITINPIKNTRSIVVYNNGVRTNPCSTKYAEEKNCSEDKEGDISSVVNVISTKSSIRRIRFWKNIIPLEYEKRVILAEIVEKPSSAYIIDNCEHITLARVASRPSNMELWKDFTKNKTDIN